MQLQALNTLQGSVHTVNALALTTLQRYNLYQSGLWAGSMTCVLCQATTYAHPRHRHAERLSHWSALCSLHASPCPPCYCDCAVAVTQRLPCKTMHYLSVRKYEPLINLLDTTPCRCETRLFTEHCSSELTQIICFSISLLHYQRTFALDLWTVPCMSPG